MQVIYWNDIWVYRVTENILLYFIHLLFEIDENQLSAEFIYVGALALERCVIRCHCAPVNSHALASTPFSRAPLLSTPSTLSPPLCHSS